MWCNFWGPPQLLSASIQLADDLLSDMVRTSAIERLSKTFLQAIMNAKLMLKFGYAVMETCRPLPLDETSKKKHFENLYSWFLKNALERALGNLKNKTSTFLDK